MLNANSGAIQPTFAPQLPNRIPSLDGLRAVSILLVVAGHSIDGGRFPRLLDLVSHAGNLGVRMFFLISGFLITTLLLKEFDATEHISLKNFYIRRSLRIFPAFYVYAAAIFILGRMGVVNLLPGDMLHGLTYTMNYHLKRAWSLNHIWSLSVEEQFYLLWPMTLLLVEPRRALRIAVATVLVVPLIRVLMYFVFSASPTAMTRHFQAVADALASGCLVAFFYNYLGTIKRYTRVTVSPAFIVVPMLLMLLSGMTYKLSPGLFWILGQTIANIGIFLLLDRCVRFPQDWVGHVLNWHPLRLIGMWSYSIYLWQELFLNPIEPTRISYRFPINIICVFAASIASYYLVEQQFLKLKSYVKGFHT